jgi:glycerol-3-phosphate O-acyltransferase
MNTTEKVKLYPSVIQRIEDWPIFRLSQDRRRFIQQIEEFTLERLKLQHPKTTDVIAETIYAERIRIKEDPWKVDPPNERSFWSKLRQKLAKSETATPSVAQAMQDEILRTIINRYSEEIVGTFSIRTFKFARIFLYFFFNRLLNAASAKGWFSLFSRKRKLWERIHVKGDVEQIRGLFEHGTVVVVPTHFSNLDSILIGYAMDAVMGLPSFSYGAGLNLYNSGIPAFFMNRLGAYRVDRRKKNPVYLETLKAISMLSMERGVNSLFFPGGTRSRSGMIESKLKMGLLGTAIEAQRTLSQKNTDKKVFIIPLVLGYNFVLEAPFLIRQHLQILGKEKYLESKDGGKSIRQLSRFVWKIFSGKSDIVLSFGKPMDVLGNFVDEKGISYDNRGNQIDIKSYFTPLSSAATEGGTFAIAAVNANLQRETEYTKILSERLVERFHKDNIVLSSQVVAFTAFNILKYHNKKMSLYTLLRLPTDHYIFPLSAFSEAVVAVTSALHELEGKGRLKLSEQISLPTEQLIRDGVRNLGVFHVKAPLKFNKAGDLESDDFHTLYYYHNHLENYGLTKRVEWKNFKLKTEE